MRHVHGATEFTLSGLARNCLEGRGAVARAAVGRVNGHARFRLAADSAFGGLAKAAAPPRPILAVEPWQAIFKPHDAHLEASSGLFAQTQGLKLQHEPQAGRHKALKAKLDDPTAGGDKA